MFSKAEYSIYCLNLTNSLNNCEVINNGNGYIIKTDINNVKHIKSNVSKILGESVCFKSSINKIEKIISLYNIKIIKEERLNNIICLYGYSENADLTHSILIDSEKVNIQITFNCDYLTIGTPIILGDY